MSTITSPISPLPETLHKSTTIRCSECGCESILPEFFRNRGGKPLCPGCAQQRDRRNARNAAKGMPMLLLVATLSGVLASFDMPPLTTFSVIFFNLLLLFLWAFPLLWLYTLLSFLIPKLLGGTIWEIQLGTGNVVVRKLWGVTTVTRCEFLLGGFVTFSFPPTDRIKIRYATVLWAVVGIPLVLIGVLLFQVQWSRLWLGHAWIETLLITLVMTQLVINFPRLLPSNYTTSSDISTVAVVRSWRMQAIDELSHYHEYCHAKALLNQRDYSQASLICREVLAQNPSNLMWRSTYATVLIFLNRFADAVVEYDRVFTSHRFAQEPGHRRALIYNNAACAAMQVEDWDSAKQHTAQAFAMAPWLHQIRGTRGALLIETGGADHADINRGIGQVIEVVDELRELDDPLWDQTIAINLAYAAIGYSRLGEDDAAAEALKDAQSWFADDVVVRRATQLLDQLKQS